MLIRRLTESDYPAALELFAAEEAIHVQARPDCFIPRTKEEIFPQEPFNAWLSDSDGLMLGVFDSRGEMIALARATLWHDSGMVKGLRTVCLDNIFVLPAYRRRGIASRLISAVEDWAREQQAQRVELYVWDFNTGAMAIYAKQGYVPQHHVLEKIL